MNPTLSAVRASYATLAPHSDELVRRFYDNLFAAHPSMRRMFPADMGRQREHLAAALAMLVRNLDSLEALEPTLMDLGARHVAFGVIPEHYPPVRDALLSAVEASARPPLTPETREAWRQVINRVCAVMLQGAAAAALTVAQDLSPFRGREARAFQSRPAPER